MKYFLIISFVLVRTVCAADDDLAKWTTQLKSPNPLVRRNAALSIRNLGARGAAAIPVLGEAMEDTRREGTAKVSAWDAQQAAIRALGTMGALAQPGLPYLMKAFRNHFPDSVRETLGELLPSLTPELVAFLSHADPIYVLVSAQALQDSVRYNSRVVAALVQLLRDRPRPGYICTHSARVLYDMGPRAAQSAADLRSILGSITIATDDPDLEREGTMTEISIMAKALVSVSGRDPANVAVLQRVAGIMDREDPSVDCQRKARDVRRTAQNLVFFVQTGREPDPGDEARISFQALLDQVGLTQGAWEVLSAEAVLAGLRRCRQADRETFLNVISLHAPDRFLDILADQINDAHTAVTLRSFIGLSACARLRLAIARRALPG